MNLQDIRGKTLEEVNPALFRATLDALEARNFSPAGALLDEREAATVAAKLLTTLLRGACHCGQIDCSTYYFEVPKTPSNVCYYTVRFYARGEHMIHIDNAGNVYSVERLYDFSDGPRTIHARRPDGSWETRTV